MPSLRLHALVWRAHGKRHRLDLTVASGEVVVVTTTAEAGSALADVILGLAPPLAGTVRVDGQDVTAAPPGGRRIALVPVGGGLLPHLTVERNVAYGGDRSHARERVRDLHLEAVSRLRPHELSPVQRLQVAVARALCHDRRPVAIVLEDRAGEAPYRTAVDTARAYGTAVLVISDVAGAGHLRVVAPEDAEETGDAT